MNTSATTCFANEIIVIHTYDGHLLTSEQSKKILNDPTLTDEQVTEIRDGFRHLAEVIFDKWMEERKALNKKKLEERNELVVGGVPDTIKI